MLGQLVPVGGGDSIPLLKTPILIGRRSRCDIVLDFPNVSSQHCELSFINGFWQIRDLGSSNGIKVNGERLDTKFLQPGDQVAIAKHKYTIDFIPGAAAPPQEEADPFAMSLLEKAGLERRRETTRSHRSSAPASKPPKREALTEEEEEASRWLLEEE